ncbi:ROK family glucokinase [Mycetocola reblochoni]|uniref:Glucokinase n=2 Tax=Mycetocola reblochoni TaxID=331618 RepID=A0A1R4J723_9MICO|nr:ROK family glucokinase [Mycetocola reblochoni]RLP69720.1 ROK family protein [Mycetocola reblochoni]SJN27878.1 Glucokinase [Mycetocola reblochoni REB411]
MHAVGIDIGGTKIAGAVIDEDGAILDQRRTPTPAGDAAAVEDAVVEMIESLRVSTPVSSVGIAAAGFVDAARSSVYYAPNISWRNEPIADRVEARTGLPVVVENDANAAGWAEFRFGAGQLVSDMVMVTIGTGVGGAIITEDRLFRGGFGAAAEIGHMRVVPGGLPCGCGRFGCFEQYGSGRALQRYAEQIAAEPGEDGRGFRAAIEANGSLNGGLIAQLTSAGDPGAIRALRELGTWIGEGCASLSAVLDPQMFVIGGGVAQSDALLLGPIVEAFEASLPARGHHPEPRFEIAQLVNDAGVVGAADLARSRGTGRG